MRGHFELTLSDGKKIPLRFCTWSLKRFCQLQGIGPSDIGEALSGQTSLDAIVNLLRAAAEYPLYKEGITPDFTDMTVCDWIDDMGGMSGKQFQDVMAALGESLNSGLDEKPSKKSTKDGVKKN
jgi:hypothetical protein